MFNSYVKLLEMGHGNSINLCLLSSLLTIVNNHYEAQSLTIVLKQQQYIYNHCEPYNVGKTIINHPALITINRCLPFPNRLLRYYSYLQISPNIVNVSSQKKWLHVYYYIPWKAQQNGHILGMSLRILGIYGEYDGDLMGIEWRCTETIVGMDWGYVGNIIWFIRKNPNPKWMIQGYPISVNLHMDTFEIHLNIQ